MKKLCLLLMLTLMTNALDAMLTEPTFVTQLTKLESEFKTCTTEEAKGEFKEKAINNIFKDSSEDRATNLGKNLIDESNFDVFIYKAALLMGSDSKVAIGFRELLQTRITFLAACKVCNIPDNIDNLDTIINVLPEDIKQDKNLFDYLCFELQAILNDQGKKATHKRDCLNVFSRWHDIHVRAHKDIYANDNGKVINNNPDAPQPNWWASYLIHLLGANFGFVLQKLGHTPLALGSWFHPLATRMGKVMPPVAKFVDYNNGSVKNAAFQIGLATLFLGGSHKLVGTAVNWIGSSLEAKLGSNNFIQRSNNKITACGTVGLSGLMLTALVGTANAPVFILPASCYLVYSFTIGQTVPVKPATVENEPKLPDAENTEKK